MSKQQKHDQFLQELAEGRKEIFNGIKSLTRKGNRQLDEGPELFKIPDLEKLYSLNSVGIEMLVANHEIKENGGRLSIEAIFETQGANFAEALYDKYYEIIEKNLAPNSDFALQALKKQVYFIERAYEHRKNCGAITKGSAVTSFAYKHSYNQFRRAGDAAATRADIAYEIGENEKIRKAWLRRALESYQESASMAKVRDSRFWAYSSFFYAQTAEELLELDDKPKYRKLARKGFSDFIEHYELTKAENMAEDANYARNRLGANS